MTSRLGAKRSTVAAMMAAIVIAACGDTPEPRPQWTIAIVSDAALPQYGDRLLVEVLPADQQAPCAECRRQIPVDARTVWPVELGITPPAGPSPRVRVRLHRSQHATAEGLPNGAGAIDVLGMLPVPSGVTRVVVKLAMDCFGMTSDVLAGTTCDPALHTSGPQRVLPIADAASLALRPGDWAPGRSRPCPGEAPGDMACITGGAFLLGDDRALPIAQRTAAAPEHLTLVSPFMIDLDEVSVGAVRVLIRSNQLRSSGLARADVRTECTYLDNDNPKNDRLPLNCVSQEFAARACAAFGKRLPTETEWEYAAGGRMRELDYPWGDIGKPCDLAIVGRARSVDEGGTGIFDSSRLCRVREGEAVRPWGLVAGGAPGDLTADGVRNMGGNLSEWVADVFASYDEPCWSSVSPLRDPLCTTSSDPDRHSFRGGAWGDVPQRASTTRRNSGLDSGFGIAVGFRCARSF